MYTQPLINCCSHSELGPALPCLTWPRGQDEKQQPEVGWKNHKITKKMGRGKVMGFLMGFVYNLLYFLWPGFSCRLLIWVSTDNYSKQWTWNGSITQRLFLFLNSEIKPVLPLPTPWWKRDLTLAGNGEKSFIFLPDTFSKGIITFSPYFILVFLLSGDSTCCSSSK